MKSASEPGDDAATQGPAGADRHARDGSSYPRKAGQQPRSGYRVGSLSQESLPQRHERGRSFGASLRGVVAAAESVEQIRAVGGHQ